MPTQRDVLSTLTKSRLVELVDDFQLEATSRQTKSELVELLARSRRATLDKILATLSRDELKSVCRSHELEEKGRKKSVLVQRILGNGAARPTVSQSAPQQQALFAKGPSKQSSNGSKTSDVAGSSETADASAEQTTPLALPQLKAALWDAANTLRGSAVDRTDWKGYILPLLFFKRISDVWDEERERMIAEYGEEFEDEHRFQIPDGCHWNDIRETPANVGTALAHAMQEIERTNPDTLYRVFGSADWGNKEKFTDELLKDLIEGFSAISLGNHSVDTDILGDAYEYLVGKFADVTRRNKAGEFYTPRSVVRMMVQMLDPQEGESIYDPACGTGGMLLGAIDHVKENGGDPRTFFGKIYGQEKNLTTSSVARMNLVLHGIEDFQIIREDTLRDPAFTDGAGGLATFDCVIANPPFSLKEWGREVWENDPWGRAHYGLPPVRSGDYAFVQHMIASMAQSGGSRMAVVLPQSALFRKNAESKIRKALLQEDLIEAVVGLAQNLFYGTPLAASIVILRRKKPARRKKRVLFIDASSLFRKGRAQNFLDAEHGEQIAKWFRNFEDVEDRAKVVTLDEIKEEGWTLNISRYVLPPIGEDIPPLSEAVAAFKQALTDARAAEDHLRTVLTEGGWLE